MRLLPTMTREDLLCGASATGKRAGPTNRRFRVRVPGTAPQVTILCRKIAAEMSLGRRLDFYMVNPNENHKLVRIKTGNVGAESTKYKYIGYCRGRKGPLIWLSSSTEYVYPRTKADGKSRIPPNVFYMAN